MSTFFSGILPLVCFFFLGILFNFLKIFKKEDGLFLLKLVFFIFIPIMAFRAIVSVDISKDFLIIPLVPLAPILVSFLIATIYLKIYPQPKSMAGIVYCGSMNMNTAFILPFIAVAYGVSGLSKALFFDIGNIFFIFTFIYSIAVKHGVNNAISTRFILKKIICVPTIWALLLGLLFAIFKINIDIGIINFLDTASVASTPLIMLSLGFVFSPRLKNLPKALSIIFIRMFCGFLVGFVISRFLPIDELSKKVIILGCAAPCGFNTMVFAAMESLDERFGATVCSISTFLGIIYMPVVIWFLR